MFRALRQNAARLNKSRQRNGPNKERVMAQQQAELQNRKAAQSILPEERLLIASVQDIKTLPAGVFTGTITGRDYVDPALLAKLCEGGMV